MADTLEKPSGLVKGGARVERLDPEARVPQIGEWYRTTLNVYIGGNNYEDREVLACVIHVGSNFVELESAGPHHYTWRLHSDEFFSKVEAVSRPEADAFIQRHIDEHRIEVYRLMDKARQLALDLGISPRALQSGEAQNETQALSLRSDDTPIKEYKAALVKAETETLPKIFEDIKSHNDVMAKWMKAQLIPLEAEADQLKPAQSAIKSRIFNVELYAGLIEEVEQIREGAPAQMTKKVHLFQRRHYMDEECLLDYEAGGMEFKDIGEFDRWLAEPAHFERLLPKPRCVVAFRVRRNVKERDFPSLQAYINFLFCGDGDEDKRTFLYMRNGEQLFRLSTGIEFDAKLFPDLAARHFNEVLYANLHASTVERIMPESEYLALRAHVEAERARLKREKAEEAKKPKKERCWISDYIPEERKIVNVVKWDHETVYYDDITAYVNRQIEHHNRIALVLQGLLDRSQVFHPHPAWQLWTVEGFEQAVELVYDDDKALTPGEAPDFEAYRARLNASLKVGSNVYGQDDYWREVEAKKYNDKYGERSMRYRRYAPHDDPGPGRVAKIKKLGRKNALFTWTKAPSWSTIAKRRHDWNYRGDDEAPLPCRLEVPVSRLLNLDAYTPGDYRQFFADPRTRADYLQWAPYLLTAENFHAGKKVKHKRWDEFADGAVIEFVGDDVEDA